jgi:hypothetical protein
MATRRRAFVALIIGIGSALGCYYSQITLGSSHLSDFAQVWYGAQALLSSDNPYRAFGPGSAVPWQFPPLYPAPAMALAFPLTALPRHVAESLVVGFGAAAMAWATTRTGPEYPALFAFASMSFFHTIQAAQWSPLMIGAALCPAFGFLLVAKPTIGGALFVFNPTKIAFFTGIAVVLATTLVWPWWIGEWLKVLPAGTHIKAPITRWGGPLVLLALLRWRRREARLLVALACVPQTPELYEAIPLFLIPRRLESGAFLAGLTFVVWGIREQLRPYDSYESWMDVSGTLMVLLLYLPMLVLVLRRPNDRDDHDTLPGYETVLASLRRVLSR